MKEAHRKSALEEVLSPNWTLQLAAFNHHTEPSVSNTYHEIVIEVFHVEEERFWQGIQML